MAEVQPKKLPRKRKDSKSILSKFHGRNIDTSSSVESKLKASLDQAKNPILKLENPFEEEKEEKK